MPTYMTLIHYTQLGIESIKDSTVRLDTAKALFESLVAKIKEFYLAMGRYDVIVISEAHDDENKGGRPFYFSIRRRNFGYHANI